MNNAAKGKRTIQFLLNSDIPIGVAQLKNEEKWFEYFKRKHFFFTDLRDAIRRIS